MTVATLPEHPALSPEPLTEPQPPAERKIRTLIVDDQPLEREVMRRLLKNETDIEIVGMSVNGREAVEAIRELKPELVLLDVQMPELDGFGVVSQLDRAQMPAIIFITANQEFALKAFEVQALDYLIKPCSRDRFRQALQRARLQLRQHTAEASQMPADPPARTGSIPVRPLTRLPVKSDGKILFLRLDDIDWAEAADNYVRLHVGNETHLMRDTLGAVEERLPSDRFLRISRSAIANVEQIKELQPMFHGEYAVILRNGTRLTLTRGYREKLRQLGL